jgi:hypothetical protein
VSSEFVGVYYSVRLSRLWCDESDNLFIKYKVNDDLMSKWYASTYVNGHDVGVER